MTEDRGRGMNGPGIDDLIFYGPSLSALTGWQVGNHGVFPLVGGVKGGARTDESGEAEEHEQYAEDRGLPFIDVHIGNRRPSS